MRPNSRERVQIFDAAGVWTGGFILPGRGASRVVLGSLSLNGVGTLAFNGRIAADEPSGIRMADDGVCARRHAAAIDRTAAQDRP